jgi:hypothetical protein
VRGGVHAVDVHQGARRVREVGDLPDRRHRPDRVAGRGHRHQTGTRTDQIPVLSHRQLAGGQVDIRPAHGCPGLHPRPDVGVVVEPGQHHLVALTPASRQRAGHQVGQRGGARAEDHPGRIAADQIRDRRAGRADDLAGPAGGLVRGAPVRHRGAHRPRDRGDHRLGGLGAAGPVEVHEPLGEGGVAGPHARDIEDHEPSLLGRRKTLETNLEPAALRD